MQQIEDGPCLAWTGILDETGRPHTMDGFDFNDFDQVTLGIRS